MRRLCRRSVSKDIKIDQLFKNESDDKIEKSDIRQLCNRALAALQKRALSDLNIGYIDKPETSNSEDHASSYTGPLGEPEAILEIATDDDAETIELQALIDPGSYDLATRLKNNLNLKNAIT